MIITQENIAYLSSFFLARGAAIPGSQILPSSVTRDQLSFPVPTTESVDAAQTAAATAQATADVALSNAGGANSSVSALASTVSSLSSTVSDLQAALLLAEGRILDLETELAAAFDGTQVVVEDMVGPITKTITIANGLITGVA